MRGTWALALACLSFGCTDRAPKATAPETPVAGPGGATTEKRKPDDPRLPPGCVSSCKREADVERRKCLATGGNENFCKQYYDMDWQQCVSERCAP